MSAVAEVSANPMVSATARVAKVQKETHDTFTLTMEAANGVAR
jgi:hypothetical protein